MSPAKFHLNRNFINGPRPSPLKIHKESHLIHKSSSSSSSNSSSSTLAIAPVLGGAKQQRNHRPVIIYAHSPKVIHTHAKDFMSLVQKLTGLSSSNVNDEPGPSIQQLGGEGGILHKERGKISTKPVVNDDNESSSISTEENCAAAAGIISPILKPSNNAHFADIPLFTPNSSDFFCSSWPAYRFSDPVFPSPNPISPSVLDIMKGLPEYWVEEG